MASGLDTSTNPDALTRIWTEALGDLSADPGHSFFAQGGDSLCAMRLCARLQEQLGIEVALRDVFEAPTLPGLLARLEGRRTPPAPLPIPTLEQAPTLSWSQERMCFMHELAATSAAYHVTMAWKLRGGVDVAALRQALLHSIARHDALRMTIVSADGQPQATCDTAPPAELVDVSLGGTGDEHPLTLDEYLCEFANGPFILDRGPLLRAALVRGTGGDSTLVIVMHHAVSDQWSLDIFIRDLATAYLAAKRGNTTEEEAVGSFVAYAAAHRTWYQQHRHAVELAYWKRTLQGLEPAALHEDFVRPPQQNFSGEKLRRELGPRRILALRALGAAHDATLAMVLLACLQLLLRRHTGRDDIAVGVPVAARQHLSSADLVGTLVNTLVIRTRFGSEPDFATVLTNVRSAMLEALEHQDLPFDLLVRELDPKRDASRAPLFSVMFNGVNTPPGRELPAGVPWTRHEFDKRASQFDLTVAVDADHTQSIYFEYSTALFTVGSMERLADHYLQLVDAVLADPLQQVDTIPLSPESEQRLLDEWSRGARLARTRGTLQALILPQLARGGSRVAVICGAASLTCQQLEQQSLNVARSLASRGVGRGSLVGLHLKRSPLMLVAMLGVLRSGAAYVPLDPAFPVDRLTYMTEDAKLALLITDSAHETEVPWPQACHPVLLSSLLLDAGDAPPLPVDIHPEDPAYVIYTSGSTGKPKGVAVPRSAVVNFLRSMAERPGLHTDDRLLAITTLGFDIAVLELLLPLVTGAQVVIATQAEQTDGQALGILLRKHGITVMQATPSTWRLLIDSGWTGTDGLRALVGGEPLTRELADQLLGRCAEVWNMYGPTETTVWSSCGRIEAGARHRISLGTPIANTLILVLDQNLQICPVGVAGEICIGGDGLALGYLHRPELTAERFIANPHSRDRRTARLYRTGDRGRWRQDGQLEHLGRLDTQVKMRGYRIELGEIESRLVSHPDIAAAVVLASSVEGGEPALLAWVVPRAEALPPLQAIREHLRQWLPEYMLPQYVTPLETIPLLPNGKLDRQALPAPQLAALRREPPVPPATTLQEALWEIWRQTLGRADFGIHDNLFEIGGHSLLAVRMATRIRTELQRDCNLALLFRYPDIASLAAALSQAPLQPGSLVVPLQTSGEGPELFCLCGIAIYRELAGHLAPDVPVCGVFVSQEMAFLDEADASQGAGPDVPALAREYLNAIRARQPRGPYRLAGFSFGGVLAFEVAQQLRSAGGKVECLAILDSDVPGGPPEGRLERLRRRIREWRQGRDAPADPLLFRRNLRYLAAIRHYQPRRYGGKALLVRSADPPIRDPGYDWAALTASLATLDIADSHLGILKSDSARHLAAFVREGIAGIRRN